MPHNEGSKSRHTLKDIVLGKPLRATDPGVFHHVSLVAFLAWVGLGADGLSSSAYGPEEAYKALGAHAPLAVILVGMTAFTVFVISFAYSKLIEEFPGGGGGLPRRDETPGAALRGRFRVRSDRRLHPDDLGLGRVRRRRDLQPPSPPASLPQARNLHRGPRSSRHPESSRRQGVRHVSSADLPRLLPHAPRPHPDGRPGPFHGASERAPGNGERFPRGRVGARVRSDALHSPPRVFDGRRDLHGDRGRFQRRPDPARTASPQREKNDALHGSVPRVHGRRHSLRVSPRARASRGGQDDERRSCGEGLLRLEDRGRLRSENGSSSRRSSPRECSFSSPRRPDFSTGRASSRTWASIRGRRTGSRSSRTGSSRKTASC